MFCGYTGVSTGELLGRFIGLRKRIGLAGRETVLGLAHHTRRALLGEGLFFWGSHVQPLAVPDFASCVAS